MKKPWWRFLVDALFIGVGIVAVCWTIGVRQSEQEDAQKWRDQQARQDQDTIWDGPQVEWKGTQDVEGE